MSWKMDSFGDFLDSNRDSMDSLQLGLEKHTQQDIEQDLREPQNFQYGTYPTPNSANIFCRTNDKPFVSPFPNMQGHLSVDLEMDEVSDAPEPAQIADCYNQMLFTPMLSPAATPTHGYQASQEIDWERFDQSLFALTDPALTPFPEQTSYPLSPRQSIVPSAQPAKKLCRRIAPSAANSVTSSPTSGVFKQSPRKGSRKQETLQPPYPVKRSDSPVDFEGLSPASLKQNTTPGMAPIDEAASLLHLQDPSRLVPLPVSHMDINAKQKFASSEFITPITPSILMQLPEGQTPQTQQQQHLYQYRFGQNIFTNTEGMGIGSTMPSPSMPAQNNTTTTTIRAKQRKHSTNRPNSVSSSPALLAQNPGSRPQASPELRPILPGGMSPQVGAMLASKSNYQHIMDGTYEQLNLSYPSNMHNGLENRRTSHKAAEQKRRDHLKECFDQLRHLLPEKLDGSASKVILLKKCKFSRPFAWCGQY